MKNIFQATFLTALLTGISTIAYGACSPHSHNCQYHGATSSVHAGTQNVHHTKGVQITPNIPDTQAGLYIYSTWDDNASGQQADIDVDVLLPANTSGVNVISDLGFGAAPADPFNGIAGEHTRHIDTNQYQITFSNNNATAIHSADANGLSNIPNGKACDAGAGKSCEFVQIKGHIPTGVYTGAATNYDVKNLSDPSTPNNIISAELIRGDRNDPNYITGELVSADHSGLTLSIEGALNGKGATSGLLPVKFVNTGIKPHADGVVLDSYQKTYNSKDKYSNRYKTKDANFTYTKQDVRRDYWGIKYQDTINAQGKVTDTVNKGVAWRKNNVYVRTNLVGKQAIPKPKPVVRAYTAGQIGIGSQTITPYRYDPNPFSEYSKQLQAAKVKPVPQLTVKYYTNLKGKSVTYNELTGFEKGVLTTEAGLNNAKQSVANGVVKTAQFAGDRASMVKDGAMDGFESALIRSAERQSLAGYNPLKHGANILIDGVQFPVKTIIGGIGGAAKPELEVAGQAVGDVYNTYAPDSVKNSVEYLGEQKESLKENYPITHDFVEASFQAFPSTVITKGKIPNGKKPIDSEGVGDVTKRIDYSSIENPLNAGSGNNFTLRQKQAALELNKDVNGGVVKSDLSGITLVKPQKSQRGVTPDPNEWQFDHIIPKSCGGTNCSQNLQILSRQENRAKSDN